MLAGRERGYLGEGRDYLKEGRGYLGCPGSDLPGRREGDTWGRGGTTYRKVRATWAARGRAGTTWQRGRGYLGEGKAWGYLGEEVGISQLSWRRTESYLVGGQETTWGRGGG